MVAVETLIEEMTTEETPGGMTARIKVKATDPRMDIAEIRAREAIRTTANGESVVSNQKHAWTFKRPKESRALLRKEWRTCWVNLYLTQLHLVKAGTQEV